MARAQERLLERTRGRRADAGRWQRDPSRRIWRCVVAARVRAPLPPPPPQEREDVRTLAVAFDRAGSREGLYADLVMKLGEQAFSNWRISGPHMVVV